MRKENKQCIVWYKNFFSLLKGLGSIYSAFFLSWSGVITPRERLSVMERNTVSLRDTDLIIDYHLTHRLTCMPVASSMFILSKTKRSRSKIKTAPTRSFRVLLVVVSSCSKTAVA